MQKGSKAAKSFYDQVSVLRRWANWPTWTAIGIALIASGLAIMSPLFNILLYQRDVLLLTDIISNIPPIIAIFLWLFAGAVFLAKGLKQLVAARHASWFTVASIASFLVFAAMLPIAVSLYLDYQHTLDMNEECFSEGSGWCGPYYPFGLARQNVIVFSLASIVSAALGILFFNLGRRSGDKTTVSVSSRRY